MSDIKNDAEFVAQLMDQTNQLKGLIDVVNDRHEDMPQDVRAVLKACHSHMALLMIVSQRSVEHNLTIVDELNKRVEEM